MTDNIRIERNKRPRKFHRQKGSVYPFDQMKPGDSFYYEGPRSGPIIVYGYRAIRGTFSTEKEVKTDDKGNTVTGWRFFMLKDPLKG
jgi:hypothetical protein